MNRKLQFCRALLLLSLLFGGIACSDSDSDNEVTIEEADVIVVNEGNFTSADGTLSTFNSLTADVDLSVFASANGFPIAATIQNVAVYEGNYYAVTNAADKVEVINSETFLSEALISTGLKNPYALAAIGDKAYVTNWGELNYTTYLWEESFISIVDLTTNMVTDSIMLNEQPQHVLAFNGKFYVSNVGGSTITIYNPETDEAEQTIEVASGPDAMLVDANSDLWVLCTSGNLVRINGATNTVEATISGVHGSGFNEKMTINADGDVLYYLGTSVWPETDTYIYEFNISETSAPASALITGDNFYGLGISGSQIIYIANHNNYVGNGSVLRYNLDGEEIDQFAAGRIPSRFIFR